METVLITGASSGIGRELAHLFANDGARLVLVARSGQQLSELSEKLKDKYGATSAVIVLDLATPDAAKKLCDQLDERGLKIDVLVNNAGFGALGKFAELPVERQTDMIQLNVGTLTALTRRLLPRMIEQRSGGVLNVGSVAAYQAGPNMAVYYATKAYVLSFTEAIREEVAKDNLTITCLAPGATKTGFGEDSGMGKLKSFSTNAASVESVALAGYRGFRRNKDVVVPGFNNKLLVLAAKFLPRSLTRKAVKKMQRI